MTKNFESLGITPKICELLHKQGVDEPTAIQAQAIPPLFKGRDILAQAQTGTGKTFAFLLPSLQQIKTDIHAEQVLVMAPTRELARQIADVADTLAPELGIDVLSLIGGKTIENQLQKLHRHPHVIIGTPGRLLDTAAAIPSTSAASAGSSSTKRTRCSRPASWKTSIPSSA